MSQKITLFQFNGCDKCFHETIALPESEKITRIVKPTDWKPEQLDVAIITGYLHSGDRAILEKIGKNAKKIIGYGSCAVTGGIFGLAYQKGQPIIPLCQILPEAVEIPGCLAENEELAKALTGTEFLRKEKLCSTCGRRSTCNYLDEVKRQVDLAELEDTCFNDVGFVCNGYIARDCKEQCVKAGAPCRGCKPMVERSGFRFLGMFGTLMANVEVATEATGKGGTDKLADKDDDMTAALPDITGTFFRFELPASSMPIGRQPSTGNIWSDVMVGRLVEELPLYLGMIGGSNAISLALDAVEAYEKTLGLTVSEKTAAIRTKLRNAEKEYIAATGSKKAVDYLKACASIRTIAGNMNLSRIAFGGFRTAIPGEDDFDQYKNQAIEFQAGDYAQGRVAYTINNKGIITKFTLEAK
jgi:F420-non-reducing hydrogenase small subunit